MVLFNPWGYTANQILVSEQFRAQAPTETSMDVKTNWVAVRVLVVAAGLLVHASAPQKAPTGAPMVELAAEKIAAEHLPHLPHAMSIEQIFAALGR